MKLFKRIIALIVLLGIITTSIGTPVYAGGLFGLFGKKKLEPPTNYCWYWNGDYLEINWEPVTEAGGYEVTYNGNSYTVSSGTNRYKFDFIPSETEIESGNVSGSVYVASLPGDKKHKKSDAIKFPFSIPVVDLSKIHYLESVFLSKDTLEYWGKSYYGVSPVEEERDGYTVVDFSLKDEKNSDAGKVIKEALKGGLEEAGQAYVDNIGDNAAYALEKGEDVKDAIKKYNEAAGENTLKGFLSGTVKTGLEYALKDKNIHIIYYFSKGREKYGPAKMVISYLKSGNEDPKLRFEQEWNYNVDKAVYWRDSANYEVSIAATCSEKDERWNENYTPLYNLD